MTAPDHRFRPRLGDPTRCAECYTHRPAPQHFGDHAGPVVLVPGFTAAVIKSAPKPRQKRSGIARCSDCGVTGWACGHGNPLNGINCIAAGRVHMGAPTVPPRAKRSK